ncbi:hypothetical protein HWB90_gp120 [Mycobacterium phage Fowlmouth]|uniref:Uncharacterized protein n=2 Tax=Fowlmouthvirus fowlmouth TaxID=2845652 RepID=A0A7G8LPW0_9CAUD|nr:hypothetical protein HWB90_gp120 [Mycobacterium phage Fowlmouth]AYN58019.1 hypothetical protein SEA_FOWLMOUTH_70 [Mycobacterium phage Fowlmouth]QNJ59282.1 hypothetical protein SEA_MRMIYAGI_69 [Mycobacterium phage MrMiyagi]
MDWQFETFKAWAKICGYDWTKDFDRVDQNSWQSKHSGAIFSVSWGPSDD